MKRTIMAAIIASSFMMVAPAEGFFKTPKGAVYCVYEGSIYCWTPNDGFTVQITYKGYPTKAYYHSNKSEKPQDYRTLRYGKTFRVGKLRCTSRRTGLTCKNAKNHGWWLGRYVGYRLF
jgi:hypothetical protein